jgi:nitrate reductase cytochrome c-type subunit
MKLFRPICMGFGVGLIGLYMAFALSSCERIKKAKADILPLADNRAYSGAPPVVQHEILELGRGDCLSCHLHGDAKEPFKKKAQKTPHPELVRCEQCHVEEMTSGVFKNNTFLGKTYVMRLKAHQESPPLIPHPLTLRENCVGCHGLEENEERLKTDHPERVRCVQCHLRVNTEMPGPRPDLKPTPALGGGLMNWSL